MRIYSLRLFVIIVSHIKRNAAKNTIKPIRTLDLCDCSVLISEYAHTNSNEKGPHANNVLQAVRVNTKYRTTIACVILYSFVLIRLITTNACDVDTLLRSKIINKSPLLF